MNCRSTKLWLLQAETLKQTAWPSEVAEHVVACAQCSKVARKMRKLENKWRDELPIAQETEAAKQDFLKKLRQRKTPLDPATVPALKPASVPEMEVETLPADEPRPTPINAPRKKKKAKRLRAWQPLRWAAVAAMILISISVLAYLLIAPGESVAATSVVDRLIDLNLQMTNADAKDRKRLLEEHQENLLNDLNKARLTEEEQQFARELLDNCFYLAENDDPIEEANLITDLADKIKSREELASKKGNDKEKDKCNFQHKKVMQMGYNQIIDRISQFKTPEGMKKPGYDSFMKYDPMKQAQLQKMLEHERDRDRPDLRKTLESMRKKGPAMIGFGPGHGPGFGGPGKGGPFGPPFGGKRK